MDSIYTGFNLPEESFDSNKVKKTGSNESKAAEQIPLFDLPPTAADLKPFESRSSEDKGEAAENFTLAKLQLLNFDVLRTPRFMVYDLGLDIEGRLVKIQVKSLSSPSDDLIFKFYRNSGRRLGPRKVPYASTDFDISACVSLAHHGVIFQPGVHKRIHLKRDQFLRPDSALESLLMSLKTIGISEGDLK